MAIAVLCGMSLSTNGAITSVALEKPQAAQPSPIIRGWHYDRRNPLTGKRILAIEAGSFERTKDPSTFLLRDMAARLYDENGASYKEITSKFATLNPKSGTLTYGPQQSKRIKLKRLP